MHVKFIFWFMKQNIYSFNTKYKVIVQIVIQILSEINVPTIIFLKNTL